MLKFTAVATHHILWSALCVLYMFSAPKIQASSDAMERELEIDLDPVENAKKYEVRVTPLSDQTAQPTIYQLPTTHFVQRLKLGQWLLEGRSFDKRGVAGRWNKLGEVNLGFKAPTLQQPKPNETFMTSPQKQIPITIQWQSFSPIATYRVEVFSENSAKSIFAKDVKGDKMRLGLAQGHYKVRLKSLPPKGIDLDGKDPDQVTFNISAGKLATPVILPIRMKAPRSVNWQKTPYAMNYRITFTKIQSDGSTEAKGSIAEAVIAADTTSVAIPSNLEAGSYRAEVVATASGFEPSNAGTRDFVIPSAEELKLKAAKQSTKAATKSPPVSDTSKTAAKPPPEPRHTPVDFVQGSMGPVFWNYDFSSSTGQDFHLMAATVTAISADFTRWFGKSSDSAWATEIRGRQTNIYMFENGADAPGQSKITIADRRIAAIARRRKIIDRVGLDAILGFGTHHYTFLIQDQLNSVIRPIEGQLREMYIGGAIDWQVRSGSHTSVDLTFHPVGSSIGISADKTWQYTATLKYMRQLLHERSYISFALENFRSRVNTHSQYFAGEAETISTWYRFGLGLAIKL
jgi:hypothetical protein